MTGTNPYIYIALLVAMNAAFATLVWARLRKARAVKPPDWLDVLLVWPMLLRRPRSKREGYVIVIGIVVMLVLIGIAQFIP